MREKVNRTIRARRILTVQGWGMRLRTNMMLIVSLKQHFPARWPEWFMAGMSFMWGAYIILHPEVFTQSATRQVLSGLAGMAGEFPPAALWGLSNVILGMVRGGALLVNGAYTRTPMIRLGMSFASAFIWTQVCVGLLKTGVPNTGIVVYAGLVVMDIVSAYRAATDTVYAEKLRHDLKQDRSRASNRIIA